MQIQNGQRAFLTKLGYQFVDAQDTTQILVPQMFESVEIPFAALNLAAPATSQAIRNSSGFLGSDDVTGVALSRVLVTFGVGLWDLFLQATLLGNFNATVNSSTVVSWQLFTPGGVAQATLISMWSQTNVPQMQNIKTRLFLPDDGWTLKVIGPNPGASQYSHSSGGWASRLL